MSKDLFDDLDLGDLFAPKKEEKKQETNVETPKAPIEEKKEAPVVEEQQKAAQEEVNKEEITDLAKDLVNELKPGLEASLDDIFSGGQIFTDTATDYVKEELVKALKEKHEVEFRDIFVKIDVMDDNLYDVVKVEEVESSGESEDVDDEPQESYIKIAEKLPNIQAAVDKAVEYLFKETGYKPGDDKKGKGKGKNKKGGASSTSAKPKVEEKPYEGPRTIKVWGRELFVETDPKVTEDQIKEKIARDYGMPEFASPDVNVKFALDKATGILNVGISFDKRG